MLPHFSSSYIFFLLHILSLYFFSVSTTNQGTSDSLYIPYPSLTTINNSRELLLSHRMGKQTNHLNQAAQRAGVVVESGTQGCTASTPLHSLRPPNTTSSHPPSRHPQNITTVCTSPLGACIVTCLLRLWAVTRWTILAWKGIRLTFLSYFLHRPEGRCTGSGCLMYMFMKNHKMWQQEKNLAIWSGFLFVNKKLSLRSAIYLAQGHHYISGESWQLNTLEFKFSIVTCCMPLTLFVNEW